jgi:hypothetical protein
MNLFECNQSIDCYLTWVCIGLVSAAGVYILAWYCRLLPRPIQEAIEFSLETLIRAQRLFLLRLLNGPTVTAAVYILVLPFVLGLVFKAPITDVNSSQYALTAGPLFVFISWGHAPAPARLYVRGFIGGLLGALPAFVGAPLWLVYALSAAAATAGRLSLPIDDIESQLEEAKKWPEEARKDRDVLKWIAEGEDLLRRARSGRGPEYTLWWRGLAALCVFGLGVAFVAWPYLVGFDW